MKNTKSFIAGLALIAVLSFSQTAAADFLDAGEGSFVAVQVERSGTVSIFRRIPQPLNSSKGFGVPPSDWEHPVCKNLDRAVLTRVYFGETIISNQKAFDDMYDLLVRAASFGVPVRIFADPTTCHSQGWPLIRSVRLGYAGLDPILPTASQDQ